MGSEWAILATVMWIGAIITAFFTGRVVGQHEERAQTDLLRDRVNTLCDRLDKLEGGR